MLKLMQKVERLWGAPLFFTEGKESEPKSYESFYDLDSPFYHSKELSCGLIERYEKQGVPVIYRDEAGAYFCCVYSKKKGGYYLTGPVCCADLNPAQLHNLYKRYGIRAVEEKHPVKMSFYRILMFVEVLHELVCDESIEDYELLKTNGLVEEGDYNSIEKDSAIIELKHLQDDFYHHTYQDERYAMEAVREGDGEAVMQRMAGNLFETVGILSDNRENHYRYLTVIVVAMATREAIAGGVSPSEAYRMSDIFINRIDKCETVAEMMTNMREAAMSFAEKVADNKSKKAVSNYTEQCKDYIFRNYHNKILLDDIADAIGVSGGHLSRVFRADTGMNIQDYIVNFRVERAKNLLKYSEAGISEISDYVCFNSQSHFGNVFKKYTGLTPKQYRDQYKEKEFQSKK